MGNVFSNVPRSDVYPKDGDTDGAIRPADEHHKNDGSEKKQQQPELHQTFLSKLLLQSLHPSYSEDDTTNVPSSRTRTNPNSKSSSRNDPMEQLQEQPEVNDEKYTTKWMPPYLSSSQSFSSLASWNITSQTIASSIQSYSKMFTSLLQLSNYSTIIGASSTRLSLLLNRPYDDVVIVVTMSLFIVATAIMLLLLYKKKRKKWTEASATTNHGRRQRSESLNSLISTMQHDYAVDGDNNHNTNHYDRRRKRTNSSTTSLLEQQANRRMSLGRHRLNSSADIYRDIDLQEEGYFNDNSSHDKSNNQYEDFDLVVMKGRSSNNNNNLLFQNRQHLHKRIKYYGPTVNRVKYSTVTPPPTWEVASRQLLMKGTTTWQLKRIVSFVLTNNNSNNNNNNNRAAGDTTTASSSSSHPATISSPATLVIQEASTKSLKDLSKKQRKEYQSNIIEYPVQSVSVHVKVPSEGGVLELYRCSIDAFTSHNNVIHDDNNNNDSKNWKMEHTFTSAVSAAQFQIDLLGLQLLWPNIYHMYQAFAVIHKGSMSYAGNEPVVHHTTRLESTTIAATTTTSVSSINNEGAAEDVSSSTATVNSTGGSGGGTGNVVASLGNNNNQLVTSTIADVADGASSNPSTKDMSNNILTAEESGIAWDDVMRCLGSSFPSVKRRLGAIWWMAMMGERKSMQHPSPLDTMTGKTGTTPRARKDTAGSLTSFDGNDAKPGSAQAARATSVPAGAATGGNEPRAAVDDDYDRFTGGGSALLESEYINKRVLLGPVDFYRLFVPILPETATPLSDSCDHRVEQMLRWRKRVARASVLVRAYTRARIVANQGWNIGIDDTILRHSLGYIKRRLSYDDSICNKLHDATTADEYYEPAVSRDVFYMVRGEDYLTYQKINKEHNQWEDWLSLLKDGGSVRGGALSLYQGFTLVGAHIFHWPADDESLPLHYTKDPVRSIPSLNALIRGHPDLDFFVHSMFLMPKNCVLVKVFVRSLPKGVDPKFDKVVSRFFNGNVQLRKRKLEILFQLGIDSAGMSLSSRFILWLFSFFLRITLVGRTSVSQSVNSERTTIPAINLTLLGENHHFGGALTINTNGSASNYVSSTLFMDSKRQNSYVARVVLSFISSRYMANNVTDLSYNLAGESPDELPERILGTSRHVRFSMKKKLSMDSLVPGCSTNAVIHHDIDVPSPIKSRRHEGIPSLCFQIFVTDPLVATASAYVRTRNIIGQVDDPTVSPCADLSRIATSPLRLLQWSPGKTKVEKASVIVSGDPFEQAVNELIRILDGVRVPVRKAQLTNLDLKRMNAPTSNSDDDAPSNTSGGDDIVQMSVLRRLSRADIQRYFIASNCSLKTAAVRIVESTAWKGMTFPIDTRSCRIELQNGQFFQQGYDFQGNPVYYFRNMLLGPWRKDEDAVIAATLHRLETSFTNLMANNAHLRCTLIVVMGKPYVRKRKEMVMQKTLEQQRQAKGKSLDGGGSVRSVQNTTASTAGLTTLESVAHPGGTTGVSSVESVANEGDSVATDGEETALNYNDGFDEAAKAAPINNPRIPSDEQWHTHATKRLIERLVDILMMHYPERLNKALIVIGHGNKSFVRSAMGGTLALGSLISSSRTRDKIRFLRRYRDLQLHVPQNELITLVGGTQQSKMQHFECL